MHYQGMLVVLLVATGVLSLVRGFPAAVREWESSGAKDNGLARPLAPLGLGVASLLLAAALSQA